jgi:hypothetical protein
MKKIFFFPFSMHPKIYKLGLHKNLNELQNNERKIKVFFAGSVFEKYYFQLANRVKNILIRPEVINTLFKRLSKKVIRIKNKEKYDSLLNRKYTNKCIIIDSAEFRINRKKWMESISKCDFFLCPPGDWTMCHNIIEAMAVGSIPITNYAEWLHPHLKHMENCIVFNTKKDLVNKIRLVLKMNKKQIIRIRKNVIQYYNDYLDVAPLFNHLESIQDYHINMMVIAVAPQFRSEYLPNVNKNSIIVR